MQIIAHSPRTDRARGAGTVGSLCLVDLLQHWLHDLLSEAVAAPAASPHHPRGHRTHRGRLRQPPAAGRVRPAMTRPNRNEVAREPRSFSTAGFTSLANPASPETSRGLRPR